MKKLVSFSVEMLRTNGLLHRGEVFVVAASGGLDSTMLCHVMRQVAERWELRLHFAYVHHGLRPEADDEVQFVERLAAELNADFHLAHVDVKGELKRGGGSLQDAARRLRYAALENIREAVGAAAVLTAHHADDQAETVLAHVLRGSGVRGLTGIRPLLGNVARPLLEVSREELHAAAVKHGIVWMDDASNDSDAYTRNAIRHHVMPAIEQHVSPGIRSVLGDTARIFTALQNFLDAHAAGLLAQAAAAHSEAAVSLAVPALKGYFEFERMLLLRVVIADLRAGEPSFDEVHSVLRLLDAESGRKAVLHGGVIALREHDAITLFREREPIESAQVRLGEPLSYAGAMFCSTENSGIPDMSKEKSSELVDIAYTGTEWLLRPWNDEDVFVPFGGGGAKRLRDFLADAGFSARSRERIPVLEGENGIVWVCGVRLDQRAALTDKSVRTATIEFHPEHQK